VGQPDFSLTLSSQTATVIPGGSAMVTVGASPVAGFNSAIALSCPNAPVGLTCAFSANSITPGASSTLTISAVASRPASGYEQTGITMAWLPLSGLGLVGAVFADRREKGKKRRKTIMAVAGLGLLILLTLAAVGCGGGSSSSAMAAKQTVTVMVNGTSGTDTHATPVTVTIQ